MLDFDGWGFIHAIEQNLHCNRYVMEQKTRLGGYREAGSVS